MKPSIEVHASRWVNYALAYNRIPFVGAIQVSQIGLATPSTLSVHVEDHGRSLTHPFEIELEPDADGVQILSPVHLQFDLAAMSQVDEDLNAQLVVTVSADDQTVEDRSELLVGSSSTWKTMPVRSDADGSISLSPLSIESLASFVRPNDPEVTVFLAGVRARLERTTGSSSTEGYQSGPERVDAIAQAVWDEARESDISYSNPPASWSMGQKIRTPLEVLGGHVGTCLDTTVVLAAALEHVGVHPLLFLVEGHAFVGYWRQEAVGLQSVEALEDAANAVDAGLIRVLETTTVCGGPNSEPFDSDVHEKTRGRYLTGTLSAFEGVVDVNVARLRNNIVPLPVRQVAADGAVSVIEYVPAEHSGHRVSPGDRSPAAVDRAAASSVPGRVQSWKNSLLDLSLRNKLINFSERSAIQLAVPAGGIGHLEDLLNADQILTLLPGDQITATQKAQGFRLGADIPTSQLRELLDTKHVFTDITTGDSLDPYLRKMRNFAYKARTIEEETGANNLYLALGSLHWQIDGRPLKSPLILLPVTLSPGSRRGLYRLQLDDAGGSTPNYCLVEKLRQVDGLVVPGLENPVEDAHGIDLEATFAAVRDAIMAKDLPYRVDETADIAILQFAKFRLWKDLDDDWEGLMVSPLVRHLVENPTGEFTDPAAKSDVGDLDDLDARCPIPADASQLEAVASAVAGRTFVLEGPPGTGKSQTITNLLGRAIASGKRVLFVAEKRAALDVVSSRLNSVGMGPFSLDLHDKSSKPAAVRQQIKQALDLSLEFDSQGLTAQQESVESARRKLQRYTSRLHEKNTAGLSFYTARTQFLAYPEDLPALPITSSQLTSLSLESLDQLRNVLRTLEDTADLARPQPQHPWGFIRRQVEQQSDVLMAASRFEDAVSNLPPNGAVRSLLDQAVVQADLDALVEILHGPAISLEEIDGVRTRRWSERKVAYLETLSTTAAQTPAVLQEVDPDALDLPLSEVQAAVSAAASSGFFGRKKRVHAALVPLTPYLDGTVRPKEAAALTDGLVKVRSEVDRVAPERSGLSGLRPTPRWNVYKPDCINHVHDQLAWLETQAARLAPAVDGADPFGSAMREFVAADQMVSDQERTAARAVAVAARALWEAAGATAEDLGGWADGRALIPLWMAGAAARSVGSGAERSLSRWVSFVEQARLLRDFDLEQAYDAVLEGRVGSVSAVASLEKGISIASLEERLFASGFDQFDAAAHDKTVQRFASSMKELRLHLQQSVAADVLAARPFHSGTDRGQVGALKRELTRQRGGMKVRELLTSYGDLITQVMPCVLVSPDSVARFFPVGSITFDLVVFDEASQIRVADAVGAMGRATSVVVVGDSKQMPPTSFAEPADDGGLADELLVQPDEESILTEVAQAGVDRLALTWHYRSQDESLIAFSNENYYENRLSSFPAPRARDDEDGRPVAGVSLVKVAGTFIRAAGKEKGTNRVEAEAIVAEILRRFRASRDRIPSIGVVTFNMPQRTLVETLLRDLENPRILEAMDGTNGEGLFVKNLENVQGDERDVILFSTAFSKNERGVLPLNFGPLNNRGGERRLNVAITRARTQVIIFTSFDPSELRVGPASPRGIEHLAAYMHAAARRSSGLVPESSRPVNDRHRDEIAESLRSAGLVVEADLGLSDFKIDLALASSDEPDRPLVAVLLDGEGWAHRRTVGDRDGLPVAVLENLMGWDKVERVWMPEWLTEPEAVVARLMEAVGQAAAPAPPEHGPGPIVVPEPEPIQLMTPESRDDQLMFAGSPTIADMADEPGHAEYSLPGSRPFTPWAQRYVGERSTLDALPASRARQQVDQVITEVVDAEGPVSFERLARLVAGAFGLTRLNAARIDSIVRCIPRATRDSAGFAWPSSVDRDEWKEFRTATAADPRPVADVHPQEMTNAIVALCRDAHGMTEEEILRETLALFGWKRRTEALVAPVLRSLSAAITAGKLQRSSNGVYRTQ